MSDERRRVRATAGFFQDLDRQLRPKRGPNGEPSTHDFQVVDRSVSRPKPPLSRTNISTRLVQATILNSPNNPPGTCTVSGRRLPNFRGKLRYVLLNGVNGIAAIDLRPHSDLQ